jgi:hypothetical protein
VINKKIDPKEYIGCCGTYCATCKPFVDGFCKGCRLGYKEGERDINRAKCKIKLCCMREKEFDTCAECEEYSLCEKIIVKFGKEKYNHKKCMQCLDYISEHGFSVFIENAEKWKGPYGRLEGKDPRAPCSNLSPN